jgi:carboxypeptidase Q
MRRLLFGLAIILFSLEGFAQEDSVLISKLADEVLMHSKAYSNLHTLTKTIGQRLNGSPQTYKAEAWAQKALQNAGADKVYLQKCVIPHWVRGGKDEAAFIVDGRQEPIRVLALGNSTGTPSGGITAPMILVNNFDELEQHKSEIRGKIVFFNYPFNARFVRVFMAYGDAVRYRALGPSLAAKYGAVGVLVRSMTASSDNNPHTGATRYNDSFPKIPALAVGIQDAEKIAEAVAANKALSVYLKTNAHKYPDTTGYNVIGELTGTQFPDQYITIGGHLDSWDPAEGAQDDGAGCVHSIEVLRALKAIGYRPKHTIRIVLFSDEENGGGGAKAYLSQAKINNEKHVFALESDAGGFTPRGFSVSASPEQLAKMRSWIPLLIPYGVYQIDSGGSGADVGPLNTDLGVPAGELIPDSQRYFDYHHAPNDVFENVNRRELELGALNMAALIYLVDHYGL